MPVPKCKNTYIYNIWWAPPLVDVVFDGNWNIFSLSHTHAFPASHASCYSSRPAITTLIIKIKILPSQDFFFPFSGNFFLFSESTANFSVSIVRVMRASSTIQKIYHVGVWTSPSHPSVVVWALGWIINLCIHNCIFLLRDWLWLVRVRPWRFDRHMPVRIWICPPRKETGFPYTCSHLISPIVNPSIKARWRESVIYHLMMGARLEICTACTCRATVPIPGVFRLPALPSLVHSFDHRRKRAEGSLSAFEFGMYVAAAEQN